ncbi:Uncharacterised protein [Mycobacteroides abscessus subsp. massiliense]|nr:Uncharacterised protein [Mycobacteroides abscessus subsp. massiliense]
MTESSYLFYWRKRKQMELESKKLLQTRHTLEKTIWQK